MNVSFNNTLEDVVALAKHQLSRNAAYQRRRRWEVFGVPLLLFAVFAYVAYTKHKLGPLLGGIGGALFSFGWSARLYRRFPRKAVEKLQREKPQKNVFCRHTISVSPDELTAETAESRHCYRWSALFDIVFTPDYIFIYNTPATAHIIPRRELGDERFQRVSGEITRYGKAHPCAVATPTERQ